MDRRKFLTGVVSCGVVANAGCLGNGNGDSSSSGTEDLTDAEVTVNNYLEAIIEGDTETINGLIHDQAPLDVSQITTDIPLQISTVEQWDVERFVSETDDVEGEAEQQRIDQVENDLEQLREQGFEDVTQVYIEFTNDETNENEEDILLLVQDSGEWYIWT